MVERAWLAGSIPELLHGLCILASTREQRRALAYLDAKLAGSRMYAESKTSAWRLKVHQVLSTLVYRYALPIRESVPGIVKHKNSFLASHKRSTVRAFLGNKKNKIIKLI